MKRYLSLIVALSMTAVSMAQESNEDSSQTIEDGPVTKYHENGILKELSHYKDSKKNGLEIIIDKKGYLRGQCTYLNGQYDGKWINYMAGGRVKKTYVYENGLKNGPYKIYYGNNKLQEEGGYLSIPFS